MRLCVWPCRSARPTIVEVFALSGNSPLTCHCSRSSALTNEQALPWSAPKYGTWRIDRNRTHPPLISAATRPGMCLFLNVFVFVVGKQLPPCGDRWSMDGVIFDVLVLIHDLPGSLRNGSASQSACPFVRCPKNIPFINRTTESRCQFRLFLFSAATSHRWRRHIHGLVIARIRRFGCCRAWGLVLKFSHGCQSAACLFPKLFLQAADWLLAFAFGCGLIGVKLRP